MFMTRFKVLWYLRSSNYCKVVSLNLATTFNAAEVKNRSENVIICIRLKKKSILKNVIFSGLQNPARLQFEDLQQSGVRLPPVAVRQSGLRSCLPIDQVNKSSSLGRWELWSSCFGRRLMS